jgi:hypothetical protein
MLSVSLVALLAHMELMAQGTLVLVVQELLVAPEVLVRLVVVLMVERLVVFLAAAALAVFMVGMVVAAAALVALAAAALVALMLRQMPLGLEQPVELVVVLVSVLALGGVLVPLVLLELRRQQRARRA